MVFFHAATATLLIVSLSTTLSDATASTTTFPTLASPAPASNAGGSSEGDRVTPFDEELTDIQFVEVQVYVAMDKTKSFLEKRLKRTAGGKKECVETCEREFQKAENALNNAVDNLYNGFYEWAGSEVDTFGSSIRACRSCFGDEADVELRKFQGWTRGVADEWLGKINKHTNSHKINY